MINDLDLTTHSSTFPSMPKPLISRDTLVNWLHDRFSSDRKVIVVEGSDGAGKTTLLAQFAKAYPDRCFTFFVGRNYWRSNPVAFLRELCTQMQWVLRGEDLEIEGDYYKFRDLFGKFYRQVAKKARRLGDSFYFVIDGLEWVPESNELENIIDLLPYDPLDGVYLLASSASGRDFDFDHHQESIQFFSLSATAEYLRLIGLDDKKAVQCIYDACGGMPGYLGQIHREMRAGISVDEILTSLPSGFQELLEREWKRTGIEERDDITLNALAILANSQSPLDMLVLAEMIGLEQRELGERLASVPQVQLAADEKPVSFVTDAHRRFVTNKLDNRRTLAYEALIEYYNREPLSESSQNQLPILYKRMDRFDALMNYVNTTNLIDMLQETQDVFSLRRSVQIVAEEAYGREEWQVLSKYTLMSSILRTLSTKSALESEIEALLALGDYQQSLETAYQSVLLEDRLQLLAKISSYMKQQEEHPISNDVLSDLERMVSEIEPRGSLRDRVIEIAADLFYVHPQAAKDLVERVARVDTSGRLMDVVLAVLALKLEGEAARSAETLRSRISDQSLREFAQVNSPVVADLTPEQVLVEAEKLQDTSGKLFLLRSWCNANRENPEAIRVVDTALEIMTASTDYAPSMRHLRQFAEPLLASEDNEVYQLVDRFDLLKDTAIEKPADEAVRLELVLASIEVTKSKEVAHQRLFDTYLELESIPELDIHCYCLTRVLLSLPQIDPEDSFEMQAEIEKNLPSKYEQLLNDSAHHWALTRRLLRALTNYKPEMATKFARKLNTIERRDKAYREILRVYTDQEPESIDLSFVEDILNEISERERRDWTLVRVLERFAEKDVLSRAPELFPFIRSHFIDKIPEMLASRAQSLAYARSLQMMASAGKNKAVANLFDKMVDAWSTIDQRWQQVHVGFDLAAIIAGDAPELAKRMLELTREKRATTPLAEGVFVELYINTLKLAIRAFPDIIKSQDYVDDRQKLIKAIELVPSCAIQCQLLADLALRHHLASKAQDFEEIVKKKVITTLQNCEDAEAYAQTIVEIAPCLFQYERALMSSEISGLSPSYQDRALGQVVAYLLSGRSLADPVNLDSLNVQIEYVSALRTCEVIEQMNSDSAIYSYLSRLVDELVQPDPYDSEREKCRFVEKKAANIAKKLSKLIEESFPDPDNITQHEGYKISAQASLARLRDGATRRHYRAEERWKRIAPAWTVIAQAARDVPNVADRALVMSWVGEKMYRSKPKLGQELLEEAKDCIDEIPNIIDRGARFQALASSWNSVDNKESAKYFIEEGMSILEAWGWDQTRDQVTGQFLEMAHSLDPEFAASLTSTVDNPLIRHSLEQNVASRDMQNQPRKIAYQELGVEDLQHLLSQSAHRLLRSFCSGKGQVQSENLIKQWIHLVIGAQFEETYNVMSWSIENELARTKALNTPALGEIHSGLLDSLRMIWQIGEMLLGVEERTRDLQRRNPALPASLQLFSVGSRDEAIKALQNWLRENAEDYVKIYDPYFDVADLDVLKGIPPDVRVRILTSWKAQKSISFDDPTIAQRYKDAWNKISDLRPPEAHLYILGIKSTGESPMHDRYCITAGGGVQIGISRSGLGKRDSSIHSLSPDEAAAIEAEHVDRLIANPPLYFKGERLIVHTFTL